MNDIGRFALASAAVGAVYSVGASLISAWRRDERYLLHALLAKGRSSSNIVNCPGCGSLVEAEPVLVGDTT